MRPTSAKCVNALRSLLSNFKPGPEISKSILDIVRSSAASMWAFPYFFQ